MPEPVSTVSAEKPRTHVHQVVFTGYPKLVFMWPVIVAGVLFWFTNHLFNPEALGWIYVLILGTCILAVGVDVGRNYAVFWLVLVAAVYFLGLWLRDVKQITVFGDLYRILDDLNLQYDRGLGVAISIFLIVPYSIMLVWAKLNDKWRITHNEFEHHSFGRMDDSLGRGAKRIRTSYPDLLELLLGMAGTLTVYDATGQRELRKIPNVLFLPMVRKKLDSILETTAITQGAMEEEESAM